MNLEIRHQGIELTTFPNTAASFFKPIETCTVNIDEDRVPQENEKDENDNGLELNNIFRKSALLYLALHDVDLDDRLFTLVKEEKIELAEILLEVGAKPHHRDSHKRTPLHLASKKSSRMVALLLHYGSNINDVDDRGWTALHQAAYAGNLGVLKTLKERGAKLGTKTKNGFTALHLTASRLSGSAMENKVKCMKYLLDQGCNVDCATKKRSTPLHLAANNRIEAARDDIVTLIQHSANMDATDSSGRTALHIASIIDNAPVVSLLLGNHANASEIDLSNRTPLDHAIEGNSSECRDLLVTHGALRATPAERDTNCTIL